MDVFFTNTDNKSEHIYNDGEKEEKEWAIRCPEDGKKEAQTQTNLHKIWYKSSVPNLINMLLYH